MSVEERVAIVGAGRRWKAWGSPSCRNGWSPTTSRPDSSSTSCPRPSSSRAALFAVYPSRKYLSAKVRTFIDFVAADKRMR